MLGTCCSRGLGGRGRGDDVVVAGGRHSWHWQTRASAMAWDAEEWCDARHERVPADDEDAADVVVVVVAVGHESA